MMYSVSCSLYMQGKREIYSLLENCHVLDTEYLISQTCTNESTAHEANRLGSVNDQLKSLSVYACVCVYIRKCVYVHCE